MRIGHHVRHVMYLLVGVVLVGSWFGAVEVGAATYYVATAGRNANPGTEAAPFRTLARAVKGLRPGDTLYVKNGTYAEALYNKIPGGTSWSAPVTVAAYPGHTVTLRPDAGDIVLALQGSNCKYIIVDGFILDATNVRAYGVGIGKTVSSGSAHHIRIQNSEIKNARMNGISVKKGSNYNEFFNLDVHHNGLHISGPYGHHGLYIHSTHNVVEHSLIHDNNNCGANFRDDAGGVDANVFRYNQVYNNGRNPSTGWPGACENGLFIGAGTGVLVYNNLFWGNAGNGLVVSSAVENAQVYNNTMYGNGTRGLYVRKATNAVIKNNIVWGNGLSDIFDGGTRTVLSNNLMSNPLFIDPAKGNFKLQAASPAIDAGAPLSVVKDDHVRVPRPQGGSYDIGAYENVLD